ncbi:MAG: flagellar biosynthetic protein FliO [Candidatus Schekmanbacteria bacterium]|nr:flagellar biosynthetic protein FliO [Candidatus Schekmanbacteria bacterium]
MKLGLIVFSLLFGLVFAIGSFPVLVSGAETDIVSDASLIPAEISSNSTLKTDIPVNDGLDFKKNLLKSAGILIILLGVMFLAIFIIKQCQGTQRKPENIKVVSNCYLGSNRRVSVLEIGEEKLLIGITPTQINLLIRFPVSDTSHDIFSGEDDGVTSNFKEHLEKNILFHSDKSQLSGLNSICRSSISLIQKMVKRYA